VLLINQMPNANQARIPSFAIRWYFHIASAESKLKQQVTIVTCYAVAFGQLCELISSIL
jgi:hypothetical protein